VKYQDLLSIVLEVRDQACTRKKSASLHCVCTCQSIAGKVAGNLDPCLDATRSTGSDRGLRGGGRRGWCVDDDAF
jgi:hypothetical protein